MPGEKSADSAGWGWAGDCAGLRPPDFGVDGGDALKVGSRGCFAAWRRGDSKPECPEAMPYFDHNATTPLSPVAREAWLRAEEAHWHNASSPYRDGARARVRLESARETLGQILGAPTETIVFTSGATEGANSALAYWAHTLPLSTRLAINPTEHPSVLEPARALFGNRLVPLALTRGGVVDLSALEEFLAGHGGTGERVSGVIAMAANNETGVVQPWAAIARLCQQHRAAYLCDASQWLGKLPAAGLGDVGWVIGTAHKFGGPKGVGFLKIAPGSDGFRGLRGGEQERSHRAGTENLAGVAAMAAALVEAEQKKVFQETLRLRLREQFEQTVAGAVPGIRIVATGAERLWNTVSLLMPHAENHRWVARLDKLNCQVSTGSACATGKEGPSHVLAALGLAPEEARRVVRVSASWETTPEDWSVLAASLAKVDAELRAEPSNVVNS